MSDTPEPQNLNDDTPPEPVTPDNPHPVTPDNPPPEPVTPDNLPPEPITPEIPPVDPGPEVQIRGVDFWAAERAMKAGAEGRRATQETTMVYTMEGDQMYLTTPREGKRKHTPSEGDKGAVWIVSGEIPDPLPVDPFAAQRPRQPVTNPDLDGMTKAQLADYLTSKGVQFDNSMLKADLLALAKGA